MDCPHSENDTHFVRCLKCQKILKCSRYDTSTLLDHIRKEHPEIEIVENSADCSKPGAQFDPSKLSIQTQQCNCNTELDQDDRYPEIVVCQDDDDGNCRCNQTNTEEAKILFTRRYQMSTPSPPKTPTRLESPRKRYLYRTSIEKWRPANGTIYCPKCGVKKRPLIKTRSERLTQNSCGAACLIGCWPFCFLPCLFSGDNTEYLHCANCKNFLGLYDRKHNCIKPNRDFVESDGSNMPVVTESKSNSNECD